jgi:hypothetical protein
MGFTVNAIVLTVKTSSARNSSTATASGWRSSRRRDRMSHSSWVAAGPDSRSTREGRSRTTRVSTRRHDRDGPRPDRDMLQGNPTIKDEPENSVLGLKISDPLDIDIDIDIDDYEKLAAAFVDEIERKFPPKQVSIRAYGESP